MNPSRRTSFSLAELDERSRRSERKRDPSATMHPNPHVRARDDAAAALAGDNSSAVLLGRRADLQIPGVAGSGSVPGAAEAMSLIPNDVVNDKLYWLRLAADRGDLKAQFEYAKAIYHLPDSLQARYQSVPPALLAEYEARARAYLQQAIDAGLADGLVLLSDAYRDARLGLAFDAVKSHACLLALTTVYRTPETLQLVELSARRLRPGEISQAQDVQASGRWRLQR